MNVYDKANRKGLSDVWEYGGKSSTEGDQIFLKDTSVPCASVCGIFISCKIEMCDVTMAFKMYHIYGCIR